MNLIEYNPLGESEFEQAHTAVIEAYTDAIQQNGIVNQVRRFFFSSRRRHTRCGRDWSSDVCSSDLYRSKTCGELRLSDVNTVVTLSGWVSKIRKMGGMTFIDLRDRYGITQLSFNQEVNHDLCEQANNLGRE